MSVQLNGPVVIWIGLNADGEVIQVENAQRQGIEFQMLPPGDPVTINVTCNPPKKRFCYIQAGRLQCFCS